MSAQQARPSSLAAPASVGEAGETLRGFLSSRADVLLGLGIAWMMIGLLVMPSGISYNPSRLYQGTLVVLLYLPAIWLALRRRAAFWRSLWPLPAFRVFLLLVAWATLSLGWANVSRYGDQFGRILCVALFVFACHLWAGRAPQRMRILLTLVGWAMAVCALVYSVHFLWAGDLHHDDRIVGDGVIATANYAAAVMGAVCVWLAQLPQPRRAWRLVSLVAVVALLLFVALTQSRGAWLALAICALLTPVWQRNRRALAVAVLVLVAGLVALARPLPVLLARGMSYRPQILAKALHMIAAHLWLGLGQGTPFVIHVGNQNLTHSHNVLTQAAIQLGLPGLLLMMAMWALTGWSGWRHRGEPLGRVVLGLWVYASVALQFDMPQLLDSPRPGWLLIWLPFALALGLEARSRAVRQAGPARVN